MKFPFRKSSNGALLDQAGAEAEGGAAEPKKKVRFRVSVDSMIHRLRPKGSSDESSADGGEQKEAKKAKKVKKEKAKKIKRTKEPKDGGGGKKKRLLLVAICIVVFAAGGGTTYLLLQQRSPNIDKQLEKAAQHTANEKFDKAQDIYDSLLIDDIHLVPAYLGAADNYIAQELEDAAIFVLQTGYDLTRDENIEERLYELRPDLLEEEGLGEDDEPEIDTRDLPITWLDAGLERMVRQALTESSDFSSPSAAITERDLEEIQVLKIMGGTHQIATVSYPSLNDTLVAYNSTAGYTIDGVLYGERGEIRTLDDLAHFKNLRKLVIGYNQVADISGIAGLENLETLGLYFNEIADLSALSGLHNLRYLYLYNNRLGDLSPLSGLAELRMLYLQNNQITDVSPLRGLSNLSELYISNNEVDDISALSGLGSLTILAANNNQIRDLTVVESMDGLVDASFNGNPLTDSAIASQFPRVNRNPANPEAAPAVDDEQMPLPDIDSL